MGGGRGRLGEQREPRKAGTGKWQRVWETLGQWPELPSHTMGISARPAGPGRKRRGLCSSGARAGQSRPEGNLSLGCVPSSGQPSGPQEVTCTRSQKTQALFPPTTYYWAKSSISPHFHFSSTERDITAPLLSKACYTTAGPLHLLIPLPRMLFPKIFTWVAPCHLDLSSNVSALLSHYLSYFLCSVY